MAESKTEVVLCISEQLTSYGTLYVRVFPMIKRERDSYPSPLNWSCWSDGDVAAFADLRLNAYVPADGDRAIQSHPIQFNMPTYVDLPRAKAMVKVLAKLATIQAKDQTSEIGDLFVQLAKLVGAKRCVRRPAGDTTSWHTEGEWLFASIPQGRDLVRATLAQAAKPPQAKAEEQAAA